KDITIASVNRSRSLLFIGFPRVVQKVGPMFLIIDDAGRLLRVSLLTPLQKSKMPLQPLHATTLVLSAKPVAFGSAVGFGSASAPRFERRHYAGKRQGFCLRGGGWGDMGT